MIEKGLKIQYVVRRADGVGVHPKEFTVEIPSGEFKHIQFIMFEYWELDIQCVFTKV